MSTPPERPPALPERVLVGLFFLSGAASLGYEVVWARQLAPVFGGTTSGVAYVTALFMGGLGLGGAIGARFVHRIERPLRVYGVLEALLASLAMLALLLLPTLRWSGPVVAHLAAAALILPCTVLMGATLPVLVEALGGRLSHAVGRLYGLNTLGAVVGVLLTGLVAIGALGLRGAGSCVAGLGLFVAALAWFGGRGVGRAPREQDDAPGPTRPVWLLAGFATGFAGLAAEVLWTRALVAQLNASTYAFSMVLAVFLAGLAAGSAAASRWTGRGASVARAVGVTQLLCAVLVVLAPELLRFAESAVAGYVGVRRATGMDVWLGTVGVGLLRACLAVFPATFLMGWSFPLLCELYAGGERGAAVGRFAAVNTLGAVLGALGARFVLLPALGLTGGFQVAAGLLAAVGAACLFASDRRWAVVAAVPLGLSALRSPAPPFLGRMAEQHRVLMYDEGVQDTTAVVELTFEDLAGARHIFANGIAYAGDDPEARRYMYLLGHLPALAARGRERAMVICAGTGQTASAVVRHEFARVDLVDISPVVRQTLPYFERTNDRVLANPRVQLHIEDGRRFVALADPESYDVVTLEPPPPRAAGVASLYSEDFYLRVREVLADGGATAQWLPLHGMTGGELAMLARTFARVFPEARFVLLNPDEGALLAVKGAGAPPTLRAERARRAGIAEQLRGIGVPDPERLPGAGGLLERLGEGPVVTDDHPRIEHFAADLDWTPERSERDAVRAFLRRLRLASR